MKIFGIGLNKTGTSTLKTCMNLWGLKHMSYDLDAFNAYRNRDWAYLKSICDEHDSFENWPWALMYEQADAWYPDAKFILSVRKDPATWFKSLSKHGRRIGPLTDYELYIYGYAVPDENRQAHIDYYNAHNKKVEDYFADRPGKLIRVCWEQGDGWPELCPFLDRQQPQPQFPHTNKTPSLYERLERKYRPILGRYKRELIDRFLN